MNIVSFITNKDYRKKVIKYFILTDKPTILQRVPILKCQECEHTSEIFRFKKTFDKVKDALVGETKVK